MELPPGVERRHLDAGDDLDPGLPAEVHGLGIGGHGIVVSDGNGPETLLPGEADELGGRKISVTAPVGMDVEIDQFAHQRSFWPVRSL